MKQIMRIRILAIALLFGILAVGNPLMVKAAVINPAPSAKVSFTFDDGFTSTLTQAAPTLSKYGLNGTSYVISSCVGMTTVPNNCQADNDKSYMSWAQVNQLKNSYGWEIGSHTATHPYLATSDPDDQPQPITRAQMIQELEQSKATLAANGINATALATPYGDYDMTVLAEIAKNYSSQRGFADIGYNNWPNSDYLVREQQVQRPVSVATVKGYIDTAIANKQWLVLVFHDIKTNASNDPFDYEYRTSDLDQIAAYVKSKQTAGQIQSTTVSQGLVTSDIEMLPNATFNSGIGSGWTTDTPASISADSGRNGSYPDPTNSVKFVATNKNIHLFSPKVSIDPNATYLLKNFLNVQKLTSGEVYFYIDEYNSAGQWISGQYKAAERSVFVEELNFTYKATSTSVRYASLQVGVTANSGITAFLDNTQWFPLTTVSPPPAQVNLVANSSFDNGIADGWTTDSATTMVKDSANNGYPTNPVNSIKMTGTTKNTHLFSPRVTVDFAKSYSMTSYLSIKQRTSGQVGFYIDEYDSSGNWISGQWKSGITSLGNRDIAFIYKPSSANVKSASLQIVVTSNSGILAYFDHVRWYEVL